MSDRAIIFAACCVNCEKTRPRKMSRQGYSQLDVGITVWCRRCEMEVAHFTPAALEKQLTTARCSCCPGGDHVAN